MKFLLIILVSFLVVSLHDRCSTTVYGLDNGLALRPPMGWLAWERFVCEIDCKQNPNECINDELFYEMAQRLISDGYKQLGYEYVNIDDCWSTKKRDRKTNELVPDPFRFSQFNGIRGLADKLHSLGLKLGIYGDCGTLTCQLYPGQLKYEDNLNGNYFDLDASSFADWQIDSFKFDGCFLNVTEASKLCPPMGDKLNATGRPMLFSCSWPAYENDANLATNWSLVVEKCNLWRAFGDIEDSWKSVLDTIDYFVAKQDLIVKYHGPGHWFDADQLVIGDFGLSPDQEQAQMAIWCIWASPLYMSNDLRAISKESKDILRNKWAIAVNQDRLGVFGLMVAESREIQAFVKPIEPLHDGCPSYALVYLYRRTLGSSRLISFKLSKLIGGLHAKLSKLDLWKGWDSCGKRQNVTFEVHDIFDSFSKLPKNLNLQSDDLEMRVNPSGVRMVQLIEVK